MYFLQSSEEGNIRISTASRKYLVIKESEKIKNVMETIFSFFLSLCFCVSVSLSLSLFLFLSFSLSIYKYIYIYIYIYLPIPPHG